MNQQAGKTIVKQRFYEAQGGRLSIAKEEVARHAVRKYLAPGDSLVIDAGTALMPIATFIGEGSETSYSVMTHNYAAFQALQERAVKVKGLNVFLAGGRYDDDLNAFFGEETCNAYETFGPSKVFVGVSALSVGAGLRCRGNTEELQVKKLMIRLPAKHRIIVADFTKFGKIDALQFADVSDLTVATTMEQGEGDDPVKVKATIVTNRPNQRDYKQYKEWLKERDTNEVLIPTLAELQAIFDSEKKNFEALGIEVDDEL